MTRPPFAEFSSLAIEKLTVWAAPHAVWSKRLREVLTEHFVPAAEKLGLDPEKTWEALGSNVGPVYGIALEDLCTRQFDDPPRNVVDDFLKKRGFRLPPLAKTYLEALRDSVPGVYEAVAVQPGHGVTIRDLLIGAEPIDVIEVSGSRQIVQWDKLVARVVEHGGKRVFTGGVFPLETERGKQLIDELRGMLHGVAEKAGVAVDVFRGTAANVMREAAPMLGGLRISQTLASLHHPLPKLINRDGDPYEFVEARYALTSGERQDIVARLDAEPALRRTGARPAKWDWVAKASEHPSRASSAGEGYALDTHPDGDTGRVVLANVTLSGKQARVVGQFAPPSRKHARIHRAPGHRTDRRSGSHNQIRGRRHGGEAGRASVAPARGAQASRARGHAALSGFPLPRMVGRENPRTRRQDAARGGTRLRRTGATGRAPEGTGEPRDAARQGHRDGLRRALVVARTGD